MKTGDTESLGAEWPVPLPLLSSSASCAAIGLPSLSFRPPTPKLILPSILWRVGFVVLNLRTKLPPTL